MSRYVGIDFILNETDEFGYENGVLYGLSGNFAPSIDIVRCRECKNHKPSKIWAEIKPCIVKSFPSIRCKMLDREVDADDFCSYGEREGE